MEPQNWTVPVGGRNYDVRLETDNITGKTFVRVDGRIATRPIVAEEEEREFPVGGVAHLLRRMPSGEFDLDVAPPSQTNANWGGPKTPTMVRNEREAVAAPKREKNKVIASVVFAIVAVVASKVGWNVSSYTRVPWEPYVGPSARFRINFPGKPQENQQEIADGRSTATVLSAGYRDHGYGLTYFDLPRALPASTVEPLLGKIVDAIVQKEGGKLGEAASTATYMGHPAISFNASVAPNAEHGAGFLRGKVVICQGRRVYTVFAIIPRFQLVTSDVGQFLNSFELPDDEGQRPPDDLAPLPAAKPAEPLPTYPGDPRVPPEPERKPPATTTTQAPPINIHG